MLRVFGDDDRATAKTLTTLCHEVNAITEHEPRSMDLFWGRRKDSQVLDSIHSAIGKVFLAEEHLDPERCEEYEAQFVSFFEKHDFAPRERDECGMGRILAIGDIHGCDVALSTLLDGIGLTLDDTVIALGDFIDRGPDSKGVIDRLIQLSQEVTLIGICGNHEEALLQSLERGSPRMLWIGAGAIATLDSYGGSLSDIPQDHIEFLKSLRDYWQTETHIFVHANVEPNTPLKQQSTVWLRWDKFTGDEIRHMSGKTVICGHTSQSSGMPAMCDGFICIDTKAHGGLWLTCLDVENELFWHASQAGEFQGPFRLRDVATPFRPSGQ